MPVLTNSINIDGTLLVLETARQSGVRRVVYAASSSAYGETEVLPKVETLPPTPLSPYALQKYTGEVYCRLYRELYGLETGLVQLARDREHHSGSHPISP